MNINSGIYLHICSLWLEMLLGSPKTIRLHADTNLASSVCLFFIAKQWWLSGAFQNTEP